MLEDFASDTRHPGGNMDDDFDASADFRYAMILTWNPDEFDWGDDFRKTVEESADNDEIELSWSTGNRNSGVSDGDRVFLLRQGTQGRGIVASGYTRGQIETDRNWREGSKGTANFVLVALDRVISVEDALSTDVLNQEIPEGNWDRRQASGTFIRGKVVGRLEALWRRHLGELAER